MVKLILSKNPKLYFKKDGFTAFDYAAASSNKELLELLQV